jgi:hypothetical protein
MSDPYEDGVTNLSERQARLLRSLHRSVKDQDPRDVMPVLMIIMEMTLSRLPPEEIQKWAQNTIDNVSKPN